MKKLFDDVSIKCSRLTTRSYSTSFSLGILCLHKQFRDPIYTIYGYVRFADEIVDSFHDYDRRALLQKFRNDTFAAIEERVSLNPILNSFQQTVREYDIDISHVDQFLRSMEMDLDQKTYTAAGFRQYILGSAEVVGLMCLKIFCDSDPILYERLKPFAMNLGAAFQKVNFLRDLKADFLDLGRNYFPNVNMSHFSDGTKKQIEDSIAADFAKAFVGIRQLPRTSKLGVYVAYVYYLALFKKIRNTPSALVLQNRIRIRNRHKATLLAYSYIKHQLNII
ncbi:MAG TPA: phytoene/squalene synthase family protein [Chryseosolibacter sp.]|nr:phytoene/squalene synthase family protein [Chryseosolibacter sp.]